MPSSLHITAVYAFVPLAKDGLPQLREDLLAFGHAHNMRGLVLIAPEGLNATVCGSEQAIGAWKEKVRALCGDVTFKDSFADGEVFKRWSVKIKEEIVLLHRTDVRPQGKHKHLSPEEWNAMLQQDDVVVLDARNNYEVAIGKFHNAIDPDIRKFHEFPDAIKKANIPKDKKVMMYCTGGIRCEKALIAMEEQGYEHVYQLDGGILAYLEKFPDAAFEGECFVFDHRVAVDQHLRPSETYELCPCCGDPVTTPHKAKVED